MAGTYIEFTRPGYTLTWGADLLYTAGTGDAADVNPLDPDDDRPLVEGEWLERTGNSDKVTRGGDNVVSVAGTPDGEGTNPAFLYFQEKGRYDAQVTKRCHVVFGPTGFMFRTKLCKSGSLATNDKVTVWDHDMGVTGGVVRRVLAAKSGGSAYIVGYVTRVFGTDDIEVFYCPGHLA